MSGHCVCTKTWDGRELFIPSEEWFACLQANTLLNDEVMNFIIGLETQKV